MANGTRSEIDAEAEAADVSPVATNATIDAACGCPC